MEDLSIDSSFIDFPERITAFISTIANMKNLTCLKITGYFKESPIIEIFNSGHLKNLKEFRFFCSYQNGEYPQYEVIEAIKAIDKACPNLKVFYIKNLIAIEFDIGRFVYCSVCRACHLKNQP